ncbi:MAG: O-antigen ligase family protein [Planctomycetes bacterium]|jgi:O-antigen ligase|nr:O-antigen ligase family protein [Planctomycetota bacterium]
MNISISKIFSRTFWLIFGFIFLTELFSLCAYLLPSFNKAAFVIIILLTLALSFLKPSLGLLIFLAEVFIGSKGYLFFFDFNGTVISLRIALWLIVMSIWLASTLRPKQLSAEFINLKTNKYFYYFLPLAFFVILGLFLGLWHNNNFSNIFFDFNNWLFWLILFPLWSYYRRDAEFKQNLLSVFSAAMLWLSVKTFFSLFAFTHNLYGFLFEYYRWVRTTGVGEITKMSGGFYRIFFQSQLFLIPTALYLWWRALNEWLNNKINREVIFNLFLGSLAWAVVIISFSRSFWLGLLVAVLVGLFLVIKIFGYKKIFKTLGSLFIIVILSLVIIIMVAKFPFPGAEKISATQALTDRSEFSSDEAAVASRWSLLKPLWDKVLTHALLGSGFGTTVTYHSSDPRVLQNSPDGNYTTYAFEWGYLEIWLKIGILGLLAYFFFLGKILAEAWYSLKNNQLVASTTILSLVSLVVIHVFTPFLNHPLGITYILLITLLLSSQISSANKFWFGVYSRILSYFKR